MDKICPLVKKKQNNLVQLPEKKITKEFWLGVILVKTSFVRTPWAMKYKFYSRREFFLESITSSSLPQATIITPKTCVRFFFFTESIHNPYNLFTITI